MRRIPRLRRPAGLSATTSLSSISPLASSCSHTSTRNISISHRKPAPTNLQCSTFARFYSSEKQPSTGNLNREVDGAQGKEVNEAQEKEPVQLAAEQPNTETSNPKVDEAPTKEVDEAQLKGVDGSQGKELATVTAIKPSGIEGDSAYTEEQTRPVEQWDAYVPPPRRSHAERYDEVSDTRYYPALTADGLEAVGRLDNWWELPEHWSNDFAGFKPQEKVLDSALIETSVRRAVIEAYALKLSGQDDKLVGAWPIGGARDQYRVLEANINVAETGAVSLTGDISAIAESLNHTDEANIVGEQTTEDHAETLTSKSSSNKSMPSIEEARKFRGAWGHGWKAVSLSDPRIKFAVRKRLFQLTGQLIPDHQLSDITNVRSLLQLVQKPPKPKTLTQEIQQRLQNLVKLPNVSVATKRVTRGDKEMALGRFKLIEDELRKRELPLKGHGFVRKNTELSRLKGGT